MAVTSPHEKCRVEQARNESKEQTMEQRPISEIAREIKKDWRRPHFAAVPYLDAMRDLDKISDNYYSDTGKSIVIHFLANASTWRGDVAKRVKAELNAMVKAK